ncbi:MAG: Fis family sigma-54 specific transcriptional regulator [Parcubacteria group bacterium Gr01-1014_70]|nr:MAG: Fis family sigma-54 specific transcriptional regulator [Parcubacteria group bacterium Gr01-1014_70]
MENTNGLETHGSITVLSENSLTHETTDVLFYEERRVWPLFPLILAKSAPMRGLETYLQRVTKYKKSEFLLLGETGTGKQLFAEAIHHLKRPGKPFIEVNCAGLPADLVENELFGHERGAYTNAFQKEVGKFKQADTGTLFLDEIGDMPITTQAKILKAIEQKKIISIGSKTPTPVDIQIIAATNTDIAKNVRMDKFRADLFYRLGVHISIPPLREHSEDISLLVCHFLKEYAEGKGVPFVSPDAWEKLLVYPWPGNIRELAHTCQKVVYAEKESVEIEDFIGSYQSFSTGICTLAEMVKGYYAEVLKATNGNVKKAAQVMNIKRPSLYPQLRKYRISLDEFRT